MVERTFRVNVADASMKPKAPPFDVGAGRRGGKAARTGVGEIVTGQVTVNEGGISDDATRT